MSGTGGRAVRWIAREPPLEPGAVFAAGESAGALLRRLARRPETALVELRGVAGAGALVILGPSHSLAWAEGVEYLGLEPGTRGLWLPTRRRPDVPIDLYERAVRSRVGRAGGALAVLPERGIVVSVDASARVDHAWLACAGAL